MASVIGSLVLEIQSDVSPSLRNLQRLFGIIRDGITEVARFDTGLREAATLLGRSAVETGFLEEARAGIFELSREFGTLTSASIPALYQSLSAGIPRENVFEFLEVANRAAIAGVTDLDTSVRGIISAMNAYGHETLSAADAADTLFVGVRFGITTFEQLANNVGLVTPIASELGVGFEEVVAAMAAMTVQGVSTAQSATRINAVLFELNRDSTEISGIFKEIAGVSFREFVAAGGTVEEALNLISDEAARTDRSMVDMFNRIEAGQGAMLLTGASASVFSGILEAMADRTGEADEAFSIMADGVGFSMDRLFGAFERVRLSFFEAFGPAVIQIVEQFLPVIDELVPVFGELGAAVVAAFQPLAPVLVELVQQLAGPVIESVTGIAEAVASIIEAVAPAATALIADLVPAVGAVLDLVVPVVQGIAQFVDWVGQIGPIAQGAALGLSAIVVFRGPLTAMFSAAFGTQLAASASGMAAIATAAPRVAAGMRLITSAAGIIGLVASLAAVLTTVGGSSEEASVGLDEVALSLERLRSGSLDSVSQRLVDVTQNMQNAGDASVSLWDRIDFGARVFTGGSALDTGAIQAEKLAEAMDDARLAFEPFDQAFASAVNSGDIERVGRDLEILQRQTGLNNEEWERFALEVFPATTNEMQKVDLETARLTESLGDQTKQLVEMEGISEELSIALQTMGTATREVHLAVSDLTAGFREAGIDGVRQNFVDLAFALQNSEDRAVDMASVADILGIEMGDLEGIVENVTERFELFAGLLEGSMPTVGDAVQGSMDRAQEALDAAAEAAEKAEESFDASGFKLIDIAKDIEGFSLKTVRDEFQNTSEELEQFNTDLTTIIDAGFDDIAVIAAEFGPEWARLFADGIENGETDMIGEIDGLAETITARNDEIKEEQAKQYAIMGEVIGEAVADAIVEALSNLPDKVENQLNNAEKVFDGIDWTKHGEGLGLDVSKGVEESYGVLKNAATGAGEELDSGIKSGYDNVVADVTRTFDNEITGGVRRGGGSRRSAGREAGSEIQAGAYQGWENLIPQATTQFGPRLSGAVSSQAPGGRTAGKIVGDSIGDGAKEGITAGVPGAVGAMEGLRNSVASTASSSNINILTQIANPINSIFDVIRSIFIPTVTIPTRLGPPGGPQQAVAHGGIFNRPTNVLIGEALQKEVVIPLERPGRAQQLAEMSGLFDVVNDPDARGGRGVIIQPGAIVISTPLADPALVAEQVMDRLAALGA